MRKRGGTGLPACGFCSFLFLLLVISGCFRPHYRRQPLDLPKSWRLPANEATTLANYRWWEQFQDPILNRLILIALANNQDLQQAIYRVFQYYAHLGVVNADLYPTVNGNAGYSRSRVPFIFPNLGLVKKTPKGAPPNPLAALQKDLRQIHGFITSDYRLFFSLSWMPDIWGRFYSASVAAYADLLSQIQNRRGVVVTIVSSVANSYISLRNLDAQLAISKKTLQSRKDSLSLAKSRFSLGETSELEVVQAEAELEIAALRVLDFEKAIPRVENQLSVLLGENPQDIERGKSIESFHYPINIPAGLPSDLLTQRPDILSAEDRLIAADARVSEARTLLLPQFSITGKYGSESAELKNFLRSPSQAWTYSFDLVQAIFDAGRITYLVEEAVAIRNELLANYRQTILTAFQEVNDALVDIKMNQELVAEHTKQVKILEEYLHLATLRYNEGEVDYLNVLDAERTLFNAQLDLAQAQADNFSAVVGLYASLGGGWVDDADATAITDSLDCSHDAYKQNPGVGRFTPILLIP